MIVFDKTWFEKHQRKLLWLLNSKITKRWFRYVLRIRKQDIGYNRPIIGILPNCYTVFGKWINDDKLELITDFRTHNKYAKRLYFAFKPLWYAMHFWDWLVADRFIPLWSFEFLTLTQFPGSIGADNPVDGQVRFFSTGGTWAQAVAQSAGTSTDYTSTTAVFVASTKSGTDWEVIRSFFLFDTSALTSSATISATTLSLAGDGTGEQKVNSPSATVVSTTPASNTALVDDDFDQVGSTDFGSITFASWNESNGTYNVITLNATGIAAISKTSITKLGIRSSLDISGTSPTGSNSIECYFSNQAGTAADPKLVVTYTTSAIKTVDGLAKASVKTVDGLAIASVKNIDGLA